MFAKVLKVMSLKTTLYVSCKHFVAPVGEKIFAILGEDRILYTPIDSDIGKDYAVRIIKKTGWNVKKVKIRKTGKNAAYSIPKSFAKYLNINRGDLVLALGNNNTLEIIPLSLAITKLGKFKIYHYNVLFYHLIL